MKRTALVSALIILNSMLFVPAGAHAAFAGVFSPLTNPVTSGLIAHYTFDGKDVNWATGSVTDRAGGNTGSLINFATSTGIGSGKIGQALNFNATSTYVDAGNGANFNFANGSSVTMCAWVYDNVGSQSSFQSIMAKREDNGPGYAYGINFVTNTFQVYSSNGVRAFNYNLPAKKWTHICGELSNPTALYVNGVLFGTTTASTAFSNVAPFRIGASSPLVTAKEIFNGKIDDVRLYNRALSAAEVAQIYSAGGGAKVKASTGGGLVGYWNFNEGTSTIAHDASGYKKNGTLNNFSFPATGTSGWTSGKLVRALLFDGSDDYVSVPNAPNFQPLTGNWSIAFWINPASYGSGDYPEVIGSRAWTTGTDNGWAISLSNTVTNRNKLSAHFADGSTGFDVNTSAASACSSTVPLNTWTHWVMVFDRTNGKLNCYMNGALDVQQSPSFPTGSVNQSNNIYIGREIDGGNFRKLNAALDDVRVYNRALTAADAATIYQSGAALANVPTSGFLSNLANGLVGIWTFDGKDMNWAANQALDRSGSGNTGVLFNLGTTTAPAAGKIGQALRFNNGGTVNIPFSSSLNLGSGDFSISLWYYNGKNATSNDNLFLKGPCGFNASCTGISMRSRNSGTSVEFCVNGGTGTCPRVNGNTLTNSWNHVVAVVSRANNLTTLYVNGVIASGSPTMAWAPTFTDSYNFVIGQGENNWFPDRIDDVRIYNRALSATEIKQLYNQGK